MKKLIVTFLLALVVANSVSINVVASDYLSEIEYIDNKCPDSQRVLIEAWADYYNLCPELIQSLIFCESSYSMDAVNPTSGCYGIAQINPSVWGYGYDTEEKQIQKCCEMLAYSL